MLDMSGWDIKDRKVLDVMKKVPRELFVPESQRYNADGDYPLPIGFGQTISQPYIVAYMTEKLDIAENHRVLEIGTGSGYQAAVLAELCAMVYSIERIEKLAKLAGEVLKRLGYDNVRLKTGNGRKGWPGEGPFDRIIVTAAPRSVPKPLTEQLKPGGRMIIPVGEVQGIQYLVLARKDAENSLQYENLLPVRFVPLV